jgi:hypothetical protein
VEPAAAQGHRPQRNQVQKTVGITTRYRRNLNI